MRLGITTKLLIPLGLLFASLTYLNIKVLLDIFAQEQLETKQENALTIASQAAMQFDASNKIETLKRSVISVFTF